MKGSERKFKQDMPFEEIPACLRRLADALEKKDNHLPPEWSNLPEPIGKLELKGKAGDSGWTLKIKIKADPPAEIIAPETGTDQAPSASASAKPQIKYKQLKKRMKSSFKQIRESLDAQKLPDPEVLNGFLTDSERMMAFAGQKYGEPDYPAYRQACRQLAEAYEAQNWTAFKNGYARLDQLKADCHKAYK
jgi:XXXCH domain-containing protein